MGAIARIIGGMMMAANAMIAAATTKTLDSSPRSTHIASVFISATDMMTSMKRATTIGRNFNFFALPALAGALVHLMVG